MVTLMRRRPHLVNALVLSSVIPFLGATFSIYHSSQSPFCMWSSKPIEPWQDYRNKSQKYYDNIDLYHYESPVPVFDYEYLAGTTI
jgi:hypothetical protein